MSTTSPEQITHDTMLNKSESNIKNIAISVPESMSSNDKPLKPTDSFLGINISFLPSELQFMLLASICFLGFWLCGYYEELIFGKNKFECGWFLATFELSFFAIVTCIANTSRNFHTFTVIFTKKEHFNSFINFMNIFAPRSPLYIHIIIGFAMTFARSLTLFSLVYLGYPTQVIFKSMKLVFVLFGSYMCFGIKYSFLEIIGHLSMVFAAILFSLGDHETKTRFTFIGVILVLTSLIFDSIHANFQEYALRKFKCDINELMIYSNGIAALLSAVACIVTKEMYLVVEFVNDNPHIWMLFLIRSLSIYIGAVAYLALTKRFGAVIASEVTTARKVLTIITSYYLFPKPFILKHQFGAVSFAVAILASIYGKRASKTSTKITIMLKPKT